MSAPASRDTRPSGARPLAVCFYSERTASVFDPSLPPVHGGAELQMVLLARELQRDPGFEVHFITDVPLSPTADTGGVTVHVLAGGIRRGAPFLSPLRDLVRLSRVMRRTGCDVFVQTTEGAVTGLMALAAALLRVRFVFRCACDADTDGSLIEGKPLVKWFYLWGLGRADLVLARSDMQQEALRVVHGIVAPVLANGFPLPARRPGVPREHVLWVGRAQELKRPHLFLDLAERFPDERFVMVMSVGDPGLAGEIRRRALAITNLTLKDGVQLAAIGAYFERAKALVNTSSIEGFPNTFVQAAMAGTPILSLDVDPDGFLGKEGLGRCASGDFGRLAADLGEVLSEPATWSTLSDAAWRHANANHDIGQVADVLAREIASIAGRDSLVDDGMVRSSDNRAH